DEHARVLDRDRDVGVVIRIGDVVEVGLVDEDRRIGGLAAHPRQELARRPGADVGRRRVVRVAVEDQTCALRRGGELVEVDLELGVERDGTDGVPHHFGVAGALLVGRDGADERLVLRGEQVRRGAEDLRRAAAQHDVLRLHALLLGDRLDEIARAARVAARRRAGGAERRLDRVEHRRARTERVLFARQANHAGGHGLERRLEGGPQAVLAAAGSDVGGSAGDQGRLDESASCQHGSSYALPLPSPVDVVLVFSAVRKTSTAFFISSIVPIEMRQCVFSNGGKSRPTITPDFAHASRKSLAGRPMSTNTKLPCESAGFVPMSCSACTVKARTSVLRLRSSSMCCGSFSDAIAAAVPKTLTLYGIFSFASGLTLCAMPIASPERTVATQWGCQKARATHTH